MDNRGELNYQEIKNGIINEKQNTLKAKFAPDERILTTCKPNAKAYKAKRMALFVPLLVISGLILLGLYSFIFIKAYQSGGLFGILIGLVLFLALVSVYCAAVHEIIPKLRVYDHVEYVITNRQILIANSEPQYRISKSIALNNVEDVKIITPNPITKEASLAIVTPFFTTTVLYIIQDAEFIQAKLVQLIKIVKENLKELNSTTSVCDYCDSFFSSNLKQCPNCGAPNLFYKEVSAAMDAKGSKQ